MTLSLSLYVYALGFGVIIIGILYFLVILFNVFISLILGILGDRIGYSRILIIGEILPLIAFLLLFLSSNIIIISIAAIIGGITGTAGGMRGAFSPGSTALVASNWPSEGERVKKLAIMTVIASTFSMAGSLLLVVHGFISPIYGSARAFRILFFLNFLIMLVSVMSLTFIRERKRPHKTSRVMGRSSYAYMSRISIGNIINGAGIGLAIPLLPLWFSLRYGISTSYVGDIFTVSYATTALGSFLSGRFLNNARIRAITVSSFARLFQGLLLVVMALSPLLWPAFSLYALRSGISGVGSPMRSAISVRGIGSEDYGAASALQGAATRGSQATSGAAGYLMDAYFPLPVLMGGILQLIGSGIYYRLITGWEKTTNFKQEGSALPPKS